MTTTPAEPAVGLPVDIPAAPRRSLLRDVRDDLRAIRRYRSLLRYLVSSSLRTEQANTVLSFFWWILDPLLLASVYLLLVGVLLGRGGPDFPIFLLTAIVAWEFFSKATQSAVKRTVGRERSMRQIAFPKTVLPLSTVLVAAIHFAFGFLVLLVVAIPFGIYPTSPVLLLAIPIAIVQLVFTLGLALFLSALNIFLRDTERLMRYILRFWFYLSPALYPVSVVPERFRDIYELNPFATFFPAYRDVVMKHALPDFGALGVLTLVSIGVLVLGYLFFVRLQPWFAKLV